MAINIPLGQLIRKARHGDLDDLKRKKIVSYCSGGYRGNIAADELNKLGFDTVTIEGGYSAWKDYEDKNEVWNNIYKSDSTFLGEEPSNFALLCFNHMIVNNIRKVLDLGAGHGRDSIFFASNGIEVEALDYSVIAVEILGKVTKEKTPPYFLMNLFFLVSWFTLSIVSLLLGIAGRWNFSICSSVTAILDSIIH